MMYLLVKCVLYTLFCVTFSVSHVTIDDTGAYQNIIIAVGSDVNIEDCQEFQLKIETLLGSFSRQLYAATEQKLRIATVEVILPNDVARRCQINNSASRFAWTSADIRITDAWHIQQQWGPIGSVGVGVQQPMGCGRKGDFISLQSSALDSILVDGNIHHNVTSNNISHTNLEDYLQLLGRSLTVAWSRFRWGLFEERLYDNDGLFPLANQLHFQAYDAPVNASVSVLNNGGATESILHSVELSKVSSFLDKDKHNSIIPNPQNLICKMQSASEVMRTHSDFKTEDDQTLSWWSKNLSTDAPLSEPIDDNPLVESLEPSALPAVKIGTSELRSKESTFATNEKDKIRKRREPAENNGNPELDIDQNNNTLSENYLESPSTSHAENKSVSWMSTPSSILSTESNTSVTWMRSKDTIETVAGGSKPLHIEDEFENPKVKFTSAPPKVIIVALDLSSPSIAQASVEWIRGGLFRWLFGIGQSVNVGILASYSNTSFPLSLGPLSPGPVSTHQLEEHLALLPYQHEIDDNVYGGLYCLSCVIEEATKMLQTSGVPLSSGVLALIACKPNLPKEQVAMASRTPITIHTVALCPNAPLALESLAEPEGSWALSPTLMGKGSAAETQLGKILTEITKETILWPGDSKLHVILEEEKMLREDDVERIGPYRRIKGTINLKDSPTPRLIILTTSSPAKVAELNIKGRRIPFNRDTPRRYWALLSKEQRGNLNYVLKFLSTSLELPLTVTVGVYGRGTEDGIRVRLRTSTRHYNPGNSAGPYLTVWTEVTKDGVSILDADVTLSLTYLSGLIPATYSLRLLDNGSTEPDIREGDGIYSRYLTWTPGDGRYVLTATASSSSTSSIKYYSKDGKVTTERTGHFTSTSTSLSIILEDVPKGDIFPPSRVTDLDVAPLGDGFVNVTWSAPGGDLDQGSAWKYRLKTYTDLDALATNFEVSGIDVFCLHGAEKTPSPAPALFGTPQHCVTSLPFSDLRWYFGLLAIDGANNSGSLSNIVSTFIHDPRTTSSSKRTDDSIPQTIQTLSMSTVASVMVEELPSSDSEENGSWQVYGIAIICAIMFVMVAIVLFSCIICCRRARARSSKEPDRPIYKIYVNNAYIQEDDGEIKVVGKNPTLDDKGTTQWVNSLEKFGSTEAPRDNQGDIGDNSPDVDASGEKFAKPVRFGVLTNGSIMREAATSASSSSSSKPQDEITPEDFKYKDLSETISNSTADEVVTGSTSSGGTDHSSSTEHHKSHPLYLAPNRSQSAGIHYELAYPPLGIPPIPVPTAVPVHSVSSRTLEYSSDDEGGFRPRSMAEPNFQRHLAPHFSSFRYVPPPPHPTSHEHFAPRTLNYPPSYNSVSRAAGGSVLPHGTVRSVKKRRHISFV